MYKFGHLQYLLLFSEFNQPRIFFADFEITSNIKFKKNAYRGSRVVPCGQTDHFNGRFSKFCERALKRRRHV